ATSDMLLIVLRPDQQDFQGTAVTVDVARRLDGPNVRLVVNKAVTRYDVEQVRAQGGQAYQTPVVGGRPFTEGLADPGRAELFALRHPDHAWSRAIRGATQSILEMV